MLKVWRCAGRALWRRSLLRHGVAASTEHEAVVAALRPDVVVDVGANRGQFVLLVKGLLPAAIVVAVEPVEQALSVLNRVVRGLGGVTVHPVACGAEHGTMAVNVAHDDDNSSLLRPTARQLQLHPRSSTAKTVPTTVVPLDALVDPALLDGISLLKVDVQGTEADVLRGGAGVLQRLTYLYVELCFVQRYLGQSVPAEIMQLLDRRGFRLLHLHNPIRTRMGVLQVDALFGRHVSRTHSPVL